jgi:hypothetical protein
MTPDRAASRGAPRILFALFIASLIAPPPVLAYVDPLSGSVIFQVTIAAFLGALFTIKHWWSKAISLARSLASRLTRR